MDFFGRKQRAEERRIPENAITAVIARLSCLEALTFGIAAELTPQARENLLNSMRGFVVVLGGLQRPEFVPARNEQHFRDEVSRIAQLFVETVKKVPPKPIISN
jgi:hypothetical protein